ATRVLAAALFRPPSSASHPCPHPARAAALPSPWTPCPSLLTQLLLPAPRLHRTQRLFLVIFVDGRGDVAILAHPPEVGGHQQDGGQGQEDDVQGIPADERLLADLKTAQERHAHLLPD